MSAISYYQNVEFLGGAELHNPVIHPVASSASFPQGDSAFRGQMCFNQTDGGLYYCDAKTGDVANWIRLDAGGATVSVASDTTKTNNAINVRSVVDGLNTDYFLSVKNLKDVNVDTNAAIAWSKLATGTANRIVYTDSTGVLNVSALSITTGADAGNLSMGSKRIVSLSDPVADTDAVNYSTLKAWFSGNVDIHEPCYVATTGNIDISSPPSTFDGITLSEVGVAYRVLVKDQTDPKQNGIYDWVLSVYLGTPSMTRSADEDTTGEIFPGSTTYVQFGTDWGSCGFVQNLSGSGTGGAIAVGTENQSWVQSYAVSKMIAGNGLIRSGNTMSVKGVSGEISVTSAGVGLATVTVTTTGAAGAAKVTAVTADTYGRVTGITYSDASIPVGQITGILPIANGGTGSSNGSITGSGTLNFLHAAGKSVFLHANVGIAAATFEASTSLHVKVTGNSTTLGAKSNVLTLQNDSTTVGAGSEIVYSSGGTTAAYRFIVEGGEVTSVSSGAIGRWYIAGKATTGATSLTKYLTVESNGSITMPSVGANGLQIGSGTVYGLVSLPDASTISVDALGSGANLSLKLNAKGTGTISLVGAGVGIGTSTVSASGYMTIAAGSTTKAPMIITGAGVLTTAVKGALEADTASLYWTDNSTVRRKLAFTDFSNLISTDVLGVAHGGTGLTTLAANKIPFGNGTGAFSSTAVGTSGDVLMAGTGGLPGWVSIVPLKSGGTGADLVDGAGKGAVNGVVYKLSASALGITAQAAYDYAPLLGRTSTNAPVFASYSMPSTATAFGVMVGITANSAGFLAPPSVNSILTGSPSSAVSWLTMQSSTVIGVNSSGVVTCLGSLPFTVGISQGGTGQTTAANARKAFTVPVGKKFKITDWSVNNDYTLTHNLGTEDLMVGCWVSDTDTAGSYERADFGITISSTTVVLSSAAPLAGKYIKVCLIGMEWS